jgi:hypothetical protein
MFEQEDRFDFDPRMPLNEIRLTAIIDPNGHLAGGTGATLIGVRGPGLFHRGVATAIWRLLQK